MLPAVPSSPHVVEVPGTIAFWTPRRGLLMYQRCADRCFEWRVQLTTDGGRHFRVLYRTSRQIDDVQTAGSGGAILTFDDGHLLRTLDGGRHWRPFRSLHGASFATARDGLAVRYRQSGDSDVIDVVATSDGGLTW